MSVYIDAMVDHKKRIGPAGPLWCHMIADSLNELHQMAAIIGLKRSWFQEKSSFPHYDIGSQRMRDLAVFNGAVVCDRSTFVAHIRRLRNK